MFILVSLIFQRDAIPPQTGDTPEALSLVLRLAAAAKSRAEAAGDSLLLSVVVVVVVVVIASLI